MTVMGSLKAWALGMNNGMDKKNPTTLIINQHVIKECIAGRDKLTVPKLWKDRVLAYVVRLDEENDLVVLTKGVMLRSLGLLQVEPWPGYWVMVLGSTDGYERSVAFGSVLNATNTEIFITTNTSHGNSSVLLIDGEGMVVGETSWGHAVEQYNETKSLNSMCAEILDCDGDYYWAQTE